MRALDTLAGKLLIAAPTMGDSRFRETLIYMCVHSQHRAMGLVINQPMQDLILPDLLGQLGIECTIEVPRRPVLAGGPVDKDRGFVLHSDDYFCDDGTLRVAQGISMTATKDVLEAIGNSPRPHRAVLALGYAGWGPGQLEHELEENAWLIADADARTVFGLDHRTKWKRAYTTLGFEAARFAPGVGRA